MSASPHGSHDDNRHEQRRRTLLGGVIVFHEGSSTFDCRIHDLSEHGARLAISDTTGVPDEFDFFIKHDGRHVRAKVVWRKEDSLGVTFHEVRS